MKIRIPITEKQNKLLAILNSGVLRRGCRHPGPSPGVEVDTLRNSVPTNKVWSVVRPLNDIGLVRIGGTPSSPRIAITARGRRVAEHRKLR